MFTNIRRALCIIAGLFIVLQPGAYALTNTDIQHILNDGPYYWPDQPNCGTSTASGTFTSVNVGGAGVWNSGLQPPYILEQFMIELLKDIASKRGVPTTDTVTEAHVEALVTFAYGEGGGITNEDFWNPFNTGYNDPALLATAHSTSGVQAFKSFDAGVEANARVMAGAPDAHFQTRLGDVLTKSTSTVADFFHALTYYKETPGNLEWAEASLSDPAGYYNNYIQLSTQTINDWSKTAALVMRGSTSDSKTATDPSKLTFHPSGA
ncbi:MAG TPA: hypothetical protein VKQ34_00755, partial [Candidatus Saccharimonadales bacterium]|nr:hypothetical protein [Candidatus Saccharimonadales bacterium]